MADIIEPCSFLETDGVDGQLVSFPPGDRMSIPCGTKILEIFACRQRSPVGPEIADAVFPLEDLQDSVVGHDEFHRLVVIHESWKTHRVARVPGSISDHARLINDASIHSRDSRPSQRRSRSAETMIKLSLCPDSGQIV